MDHDKNRQIKSPEGAESYEHPKVKIGDWVIFSGRYAIYTENKEMWVIQLTPTSGLVVNIEEKFVTIFTDGKSCVVDTNQSDVMLKIVSSVRE